MKQIPLIRIILIGLLIATLASCASIPDERDDILRPIELRTRTIPISKGVEPELAEILKRKRTENIHTIIQFKQRLTFQHHRDLNRQGIQLQSYLGGNAYLAAIPPKINLDEPKLKQMLQWSGQIRAKDKLSRELEKKEYFDWAFDKRAKTLNVLAQRYADINDDALLEKLMSLGLKAKKYGPTTFVLRVSEQDLTKLTSLEEIKRVQQGPMPPQLLNERGQRLANSDQAQWAELNNPQPSYRGMSGSGVQIGICDSGIDQNHDDFDTINAAGAAVGSRVYNQRTAGGGHGTHVASIAGGNGFNSENNGWPAFSLRGHAPQSELGDYATFGSNADNFYDAIVGDGTDVSNHSYVQSYTVYDSEAADLDSIIRGDATDSSGNVIPATPQVWAAGNNGRNSQYGNEEGYYAVFTSSKNSISVGGLDTLDGRLYGSTSLGPTFDGRIKPDMVAPGCMDSIGGGGIQAASSGTQGYAGSCGTSMAAPVVSGIIGLMMNAYEDTFGAFPNLYPSTYKALLVQTANDQVKTGQFPSREFNNPDTGQEVLYHAGPDFATGYGLVDATAAVEAIRKQNQWKESSINSNGANHLWCVNVPEGADEFKVTLAWDDEPGDTTTAEIAAKLVNDLDLESVSPSGLSVMPWTLNPLPLTAVPGDGSQDPIAQTDVDPAYRAEDHLNNVEVATAFLPEQGFWKVRVKGYNLPIGNAQPYSLVSSHAFSAFCPLDPIPICELIPQLCPPFNVCDRWPWICEPRIEEFDLDIQDDIWFVDPRLPQPIDENCKYVIDCPGCGGSSWEYCPGWDMGLKGLPRDVKVSIINQYGKVVFEDFSGQDSRRLKIEKRLPGERFFILFTDREDNPFGEPIRVSID